MATLETQILDDVVVKGRRKLMTLGGTALAGMILGSAAPKANAASYSDSDILNFALNLEYLEANFYYLCAFGTTIDVQNSASSAAGAPLLTIAGQAGGGAAGKVGGTGVGATSKVPFGTTASEIAIAAYLNETAVEEGKHVKFLQTALGSATFVAQPAINLGIGPSDAWPTLATAATLPSGSTFNPYLNSSNFLLGAYVFEDVGVTAYHGAASLLTSKANLSYAGGILAVEAYHAGLVRTQLYFNDAVATTPSTTTPNAAATTQISNLRNSLAQAALLGVANKALTLDPNPDDFGTATFTSTTALGSAGLLPTMSRITDADTTDSVNPIPLAIAAARTTTQVLNIVTGGGAVKSGAIVTPATGVFFPAGLNGLFR